jgi:transmembrane sensor
MSERMRDPLSEVEPERWEALARFIAGESSPAEAAGVRHWLSEDPARAELVESLTRVTGRLAFRPPADLDVEAALRTVKARIAEPAVRSIEEARSRRPGAGVNWAKVALRTAAAAVIVLGGALVWWAVRPETGSLAVARQEFTLIGQTDTVSLPDGSQVVLGPETRLTIPGDFGHTERSVELSGEALFDVKHDAGRPFRVRAGGALIEDLGTTFSVRSLAASQVRVVVTAGSVRLQSVSSPEGAVVLRAGDRGVLHADGRAQAESVRASEADLAWTQHRLTFEDTPLDEVGRELHRWYGIELRIADPELRQRRLTTTFQGENRQQVLDIIALAVGARIEQRGDTAIVHAVGGAQPR